VTAIDAISPEQTTRSDRAVRSKSTVRDIGLAIATGVGAAVCGGLVAGAWGLANGWQFSSGVRWASGLAAAAVLFFAILLRLAPGAGIVVKASAVGEDTAPDVAVPTTKPTATGAPPWSIIWGLVGAEATFTLLYGLTGKFLGSMVLLLFAVAAFTVGGLVGFLFGIPRAPERQRRDSGAGGTSESEWEPSTNLEQVADWLTKILVGVGLVQLPKIGEALHLMGQNASVAVPGTGGAIVVQVVVVANTALGFIAGFLWTRIDYQRLQLVSDSQLRDQLRKANERARDEARNAEAARDVVSGIVSKDVKTPVVTKADAEVVRVGGTREVQIDASKLRGLANGPYEVWPKALQDDVKKFAQHDPYDYNSDPASKVESTPREANGRRINVRIAATLAGALALEITLERVSGAPLDKPVAFLLHPTFQDAVEWVTPVNGVARLTVYTEGTFTIVAIADDGKTIVSYPLNELPRAPQWFLDN
jgi:hypothetical protein